MTINYILDTNVLLHDPMAFKHFGEHHVVIPAIVLEELESKKKEMTKIGQSARTFVKELMKIREETGQKLGDRVEFDRPEGGSLTIEMNHQAFEGMGDFNNKNINDNRILAVAKNICEETIGKGEKTVVVSMDALMIAKVDVLSKVILRKFGETDNNSKNALFEGQLYRYDRLVGDSDSIHTGVHHIFIENDLISDFYKSKGIKLTDIEDKFQKDYFEGDFVVFRDELNPTSSASSMGRIQKVKNVLHIVPFIKGNPVFKHVSPRNSEQQMMAEALLDSNINLLMVRGEAGSGKTLMALAASVWMMEESKGEFNYKRLMVGRPIVEMGKGVGYLPGDLEEKLAPWMAPIFDNLEYYFQAKNLKELQDILAKKDFLEVQALTYIRGRSIPDQLIIIDEAQNLTPHEIKTIITRAGKGTKVILIGDTKQIDHAYLDEINNGLTYAIERMKHEPTVAVLKLEKTERSPLADLAVKYL